MPPACHDDLPALYLNCTLDCSCERLHADGRIHGAGCFGLNPESC